MSDPALLTTAHESGDAAAAPIYYVVAGAPRTGSTLLVEALASTRRAGRPDEFFDIHPENEANWAKRYKVPPGANYIDHMEAATRTPNGVFGFKLHWHQMPAIERRLLEAPPGAKPVVRRPILEMLRERFPGILFIWLVRRNKVAQAISYYRADLENIWRYWNDNRRTVTPSGKKGVYNRTEIERFLRLVNNMDAGWLGFFKENKVPAQVIFYEDLVQSYEQNVHRALNFLGVPVDGLALSSPPLRRQANSESEDWEQRFRTEMGAPAAPEVNNRVTTSVGQPAAVARPGSARDSRPTIPAIPRADAGHVVPSPAQIIATTAPAQETLPLIAYDVGALAKADPERGSPARTWMNATANHFAYRCLPMLIANQWGWVFKTRHRIEAIWDGSQRPAGLVISSGVDESAITACSHFGSGILTFRLGFLFQTPPGFNLHVRGPANWPKDGICALEGIVESDWLESTFTMNWKMTRPNHKVVFEADEPVAMISPVRRGQLEQFTPIIRPLDQNPELSEKYRIWAKSRETFNADLKVTGSGANKAGWQKDYMRGRSLNGEAAPEHQTGLELKDFVEEN
jgi:LPS sulfotransferase NodH